MSEAPPDLIAKVNAMTHRELAATWRFAECGDPIMQGEAGDRVKARLFDEFGGFTPEISKSLGWTRP